MSKVKNIFYFLSELARLKKGEDISKPDAVKEYPPKTKVVVQLFEAIKGWEVETEEICEREGYAAETWKDKVSGKSLIVVFKKKLRKGWFPVLYLPVHEESKEPELEHVHEELRRFVSEEVIKKVA